MRRRRVLSPTCPVHSFTISHGVQPVPSPRHASCGSKIQHSRSWRERGASTRAGATMPAKRARTAPPETEGPNAKTTQPVSTNLTIPAKDTAGADYPVPAAASGSADAAPPPKPSLPSPKDKGQVNVPNLLHAIIVYNTHYLHEKIKTKSIPFLQDVPDVPLYEHTPLPIITNNEKPSWRRTSTRGRKTRPSMP